MQVLSLIFQFIVAIPKLFSILKEIFNLIVEMKARDHLEREQKKTEEIIKKIDAAKTTEEKQKALDEAALKWGRK